MSNPNTSLALISQLQGRLPAELALLQPMLAGNDLSSGVSGGFPVLSIRGSKWRMVEGGEETPIMIDGTTDLAPSIKVVLLKANPNVSKTFYSGAYQEGSDAAPDCVSADGVAPDADAAKPQCATCAACPHNQWGSKISPAGKKIKACADVRRVAVLPAQDLEHPPILLRVPAASLTGLAEYGKALKKAGVPYTAVVTKLAFDPVAAYPLVTFNFDSVLSGEQIRVVVDRLQDPSVEDVIDGPVFGDGAAPAPAPAAAPVNNTPVQAPAPAQVQPEAKAPRRSRAPAPVTEAAPAPAPAPTPAPAPVQQAASAGATVSDGLADSIEDALAGLGL